jgi:pimeloyl-ACP methyl ester carboxylesterase
MAPVIEGAGVSLDYSVRGEGESVLLVHGIGGTAWPDLPGRVIAYSRRGYGDSGAPEPYLATTVEEQAEDAAALLEGLDAAPAVVVGSGVGALVALDLARRHRRLVRGVVAIDPPLFAYVPEAAEALSAERDALERSVRGEGPEAAVRSYMAAAGADPAAAAWAAASFRGFFADYGAPAGWAVGRRDLRALAVPVVVVDGPAPPRHVVAASDALASSVPGARRGGTLPEAVASLLVRSDGSGG